jgi:hypothetical protein
MWLPEWEQLMKPDNLHLPGKRIPYKKFGYQTVDAPRLNDRLISFSPRIYTNLHEDSIICCKV